MGAVSERNAHPSLQEVGSYCLKLVNQDIVL